MWDTAPLWLRHPIVLGAFTGFVTAAAVDFAAFKRWQSFDEARKYGWNIAAWRWFQGTVAGALGALGFGAIIPPA